MGDRLLARGALRHLVPWRAVTGRGNTLTAHHQRVCGGDDRTPTKPADDIPRRDHHRQRGVGVADLPNGVEPASPPRWIDVPRHLRYGNLDPHPVRRAPRAAEPAPARSRAAARVLPLTDLARWYR